MDYCYNNAVIHVFLGSLSQAVVSHQYHSTRHKDSGKAAEEILEFAIIDPPTSADEESSTTLMTSKKIDNSYKS